MKLHIEQFTFNPFQENSYIIYSESGDAVIVDPGCYERSEELAIVEFLETKNLKLHAILGTHAHIDHIFGNQFIMSTFQVPYYLHQADVVTLGAGTLTANKYGIPGFKESPQPTHFLEDQQDLKFGDIELKVLFTPGHAPGHVVFYNQENAFVVNGDVLFAGSFGRVDLPGGDIEILKNSIFKTMFELPDETVVFCGHGPATTIGKEKASNYILNF